MAIHQPVSKTLFSCRTSKPRARVSILSVFCLAAIGLSQTAIADETFLVNVEASSVATNETDACNAAFNLAEDDALSQLEEYFQTDSIDQEFIARVINQNETTRLDENNETVCDFSATWEGKVVTTAPEEKIENILGSEQSINGLYSGRCLDDRNADLCWQRIVRQARSDLATRLSFEGHDIDHLDLFYVDFEGRQRDQFRDGGFEITADGRFFFDVLERNEPQSNGSISIQRKDEPKAKPEPEKETADKPKETAKETKKSDDFEVTLFYSWDINDVANEGDLAISSDRWGAGVWAKNRVGVLAFYGRDHYGIGNSENMVQRAGDRNSTFGIGLGFRAFESRSFNVESALYYVDTAPFTRTITPAKCDGCSRTVTADDYVQATVNLKTNSQGVNIGWMFTWKYLENEVNVDNLSSGLYLEVQF